MKELFRFFTSLLMISIFGGQLSAQQDMNRWRVGLGANYSFDNESWNAITESSGNALASFNHEEFNYELSLERLFSESLGLKTILTTNPSFDQAQEISILLSYYTDNRHLFGRRAFVAPYFSMGAGQDFVNEQLNIPLKAGLKFRISQRFNLNLDFTGKTYPNRWSEEGIGIGSSIETAASLSLHYNFHKRKQPFRAPAIYASQNYAYVDEIITPVTSDTASFLDFEEDLSIMDTLRARKIDTIPPRLGTTKTDFEIDEDAYESMDYDDSLIVFSDTIDFMSIDSLYTFRDSMDYSFSFFDSIDFEMDDLVLDSLLKRDSLNFDLSEEAPMKKDTTQHLKPSPVIEEASSAMPAEQGSLEALTKLGKNKVDFISDSTARLISVISIDTVYKAIQFTWDTIIVPVTFKQMPATIEGLDAGRFYTRDEVKDMVREVLAEQATQPSSQSFKAIPQQITKSEAVPITKESNMKTLEARLDTMNLLIKKQIEYQILQNELMHQERKSANPVQSQNTLASSSPSEIKTDEIIKNYELRIAALELQAIEGRLAGEPSKQPGREDEYQITLPPPGLLHTKVDSLATSDTLNMNLELEQLKEQMHALWMQNFELQTRLQEEKGWITTQAELDSANRIEMDKLRAELATLKQELSPKKEIVKPDDSYYTVQLLNLQRSELFFASNSSKVSAEGIARLGQLASFLKEQKQFAIVIRGFTDKSGTAEYNLLLSKKRSENVAAILKEKGIQAERMSLEHKGVDQDVSGMHEAYGRRVEVLLIQR